MEKSSTQSSKKGNEDEERFIQEKEKTKEDIREFFGGKDDEKIKKMWESEEKLTLEERRKRYRCYSYVTIDKIRTLPELYDEIDVPKKPSEIEFSPSDEINQKVGWYHGDITSLELDAIVNAANERMLGGGGVDGSIHRAAGRKLYDECKLVHGCPTGEARITRGYSLPAKYVIHTVGPIGTNPKALTSCYQECLRLTKKHGVRSIAFCGISTGIYGYPLRPASEIALQVIRKWLENSENRNSVDKIVICTFLEKERNCYFDLFPIYFPPEIEETEPSSDLQSDPEKNEEEHSQSEKPKIEETSKKEDENERQNDESDNIEKQQNTEKP